MPARQGALTTEAHEPAAPAAASLDTEERSSTSPVLIIALLLVAYGIFSVFTAVRVLSAPLPPSMLRAKAICAEVPGADDPCAKFDAMEAKLVSGARRGLAIGAVLLLLAGGLLLRSPIARAGVVVALGAGIVSRGAFLLSRADIAAHPALGGIARWQAVEQCVWIAIMGGLMYVLLSARVSAEFRAARS